VDPSDRARIVANYRQLLSKHGSGAAVGQWSDEGQRFRFAKLAQVGDLSGARVLDIGCGIGDLFPYLTGLYGKIDYTGIDIVPELVNFAAATHRAARFLCLDLLAEPLSESFDYAVISGVFNNQMRAATAVLKDLTRAAYGMCSRALAFNFISDRVNHVDADMAYHDPVEILRFCIDELSDRVVMAHHYERCDVAVYVYRR
jgi:SAM-dependent methyltransferase